MDANPRETRLEMSAHGQAGLAPLSFVYLGLISESSKSMAKSSATMHTPTKYLLGLTAVLSVGKSLRMLLFIYR